MTVGSTAMAAKTNSKTSDAPRKRRGRPPRVNTEMIIEAAIELFARLGYRNTTIMSIAEAVGVTDASVLHYFPNKLAILEAALDHEDRPAQKELLEQLQPGGIEALRNLAEWGVHMETHPETTSLHLMLSTEALSEASELHGMFETRYRYIRRQLTKAIQKGIDAGELRADIDAEHEATAYLALIDGLRLQWFLDNRKLPLAMHLRSYVDHLIDRIRA